MVGGKGFVAGAGGINIDLIFRGLPRLPGVGEELYAQGFELQMGGGTPATMLALHRLGVPVQLQTGFGQDLFSGFARDYFRREGLEPLDLCADRPASMPMNITSVLLSPGERTFVAYTDGLPSDDRALLQIFEASRGADFCTMGLLYPEVYEQLKKEGTVPVLDTGWVDGMSVEKYRRQLEIASYYTPNRKEAMQLTGTDTPEAAAKVLSDFFETVIVKLDGEGCLLLENGRKTVIPVIPEYRFTDATGAGDAFLAGFLYGLYHGYSSEESVLFGNLTGGKCVTAVGCLTAYFNEEELLSMAKKYAHLIPDGARM